VDEGPLLEVGFCLAEHLAGDGGDLAAAEDQEAQQVRHRVALGPVEKTWGRLPVRSRMGSSTAAIALGTAELSIPRMRWPCRSSPVTCSRASNSDGSATVTSKNSTGSSGGIWWRRRSSSALSRYSKRSRAWARWR
jgi:hypothetical protein